MTIPPLLFSVWLADHYYYNMGGFLFLLIAKASLNPWQSQGFSGYNKEGRTNLSALNEFSFLSYLVNFSLNVRCVKNLMSLVAAGLLKELLVNLLDSRVFVRLSERH